MPWPIPKPGETAERFYGAYEGLRAPDGRPLGLDPRQSNSLAGVQARTTDEVVFELWLYQAAIADELMPDRAQEWLVRHGAVWGIYREPARKAVGRVLLRGGEGTPVPSNVALDGGAVVTTEGGEIPVGGVLSVAAAATTAGTAGKRSAGAVLQLVSPVAGLAPQSAEVDGNGLAGGTEIEALEAFRGRLLDRIQEPPHGGTEPDWRRWARQGGAGYVGVLPRWLGPGTVGVAIAMPGPRVPTPSELAEVEVVIDAARPVTAEAVVFGATILPIDLLLLVRPDTQAVRQAVATAAASWFALNARVGGIWDSQRAEGKVPYVPLSRLSEALSSASGEYSHRLVDPVAEPAIGPAQMPVLGAIEFAVEP
jgi:uncharacterized phage protein gp47/JayE